jgi:hypothetical protein
MSRITSATVITGLLVVLTISACNAGPSEGLLEAAQKGNLRQVQELLDKGADVNPRDK